MIRIVHLLDDFAMGGVTRALTMFEERSIKNVAHSKVRPIASDARLAPSLDADLIVDHMAFSWARLPFLMSLRARNRRARIVHVEHSYTRSFEAHMVANKVRFRALIKLTSNLFDDVVCVSNAQRHWLCSSVGISPSKLRVIYPWSGRFDLPDIKSKGPGSHRPLRLLAYGRMAPVKNFACLIKAMRQFDDDDMQLTVFGGGLLRSELEELAHDQKGVTVLGQTNDPGIHLAACDAVIVPSRYEAFGLVATEARLAGRAIIVADVDGLPEQVGTAGRIMPMKDADEIAAAVCWAMQADLWAMGAAGRREVAHQHKEILDKWLVLIAEVSPTPVSTIEETLRSAKTAVAAH